MVLTTAVREDACLLVPGPSKMLPNVLAAQAEQVGSPDLDEAFWEDYITLETQLKSLLRTKNDVAIQSGEGMLALWGALKSSIVPGDRVVCAANGIFGAGFAEMAKTLGAEVHVVEGDWAKALVLSDVIEAIKQHDPKLVTVVHCETPSGVLNALEGLGDAIAEHTTDCLFLVDFVSSAGGAPLDVDALKIDIGLLGPQKVLSGPPSLAFTSVSEKAWRRIDKIAYHGYDALAPFRGVTTAETRLLPYTHNWHAVRACIVALTNIEEAGGAEASFQRHAEVAAFCREQVKAMGLELYCDEAAAAPTVTAIMVPADWEWKKLYQELRQRNVFVGGSYGSLAGKVFRLGHMGSQADKALVSRALAILSEILGRK
ncbi:TPA: hypothetical protein N0F65_002056 [Lagenidium giganteum]|uniref:alanine--glyoxylate transaminase n=1 Tax=Lagenidium giganteum TaxID=4803 RepID=A0AAV2ZH87_9STRA|nr:TPA: hypothetical protein N0F65_002056 [Lagenidium giganteum]